MTLAPTLAPTLVTLPTERRHASRLGFTPESWDADEWGGVPLTWAESQRDAAAREAAEALQFDEASWHGGGGGGGGADAQDDDELQAAIALSLTVLRDRTNSNVQ